MGWSMYIERKKQRRKIFQKKRNFETKIRNFLKKRWKFLSFKNQRFLTFETENFQKLK